MTERLEVVVPGRFARLGATLGVVTSLLAAVGALLPWESESVLNGVPFQRDGFELGSGFGFSFDGLIVVTLGVIVATLACALFVAPAPSWRTYAAAVLAPLALAAVASGELLSIELRVLRANASLGGADRASIGSGLYLVLGAAAVALLMDLTVAQAFRHRVRVAKERWIQEQLKTQATE